MDLTKPIEHKDDSLNDSWVDLHFSQQGHPQSLDQSVQLSKPSNEQLRLLEEAAKESRNGSQASSRSGSKPGSRGSPKAPQSPNTDSTAPLSINISTDQDERLSSVVNRHVDTDFVWDWSSRPEAIPPSAFGEKFKHPMYKRSALPPSRSRKDGWGHNLKYLLTFCAGAVAGAAALLLYLKKYCHWAPPRISTTTMIN